MVDEQSVLGSERSVGRRSFKNFNHDIEVRARYMHLLIHAPHSECSASKRSRCAARKNNCAKPSHVRTKRSAYDTKRP